MALAAGSDVAAGFAVYSPRNAFAQPIAEISCRAAAFACRAGWLQADASQARLHVSTAGVKALRRARSGASNDPSPSPRQMPSTPSRRAPATGSLAWLRQRTDKHGQPHITEAQFAAGDRLRTEYWHAQLVPRVTANWSGLGVSRRVRRTTPGLGTELSDRVIAARQRINRALVAVGPELAGILIDVCGQDIGLESAEQAHGWSRGTAKTLLQFALTSLARHYGLIAPEQSRAPHLRHWGDQDYQPGLDAWR